MSKVQYDCHCTIPQRAAIQVEDKLGSCQDPTGMVLDALLNRLTMNLFSCQLHSI